MSPFGRNDKRFTFASLQEIFRFFRLRFCREISETNSVYSLSAGYREVIGDRCLWLTANKIQNSSLSSISLKEKNFCALR